MAFDPITAGVSLVRTALNKFLPDKMDEGEKARITLQATQWVDEHALKEVQSFRNFVVDYEGKGDAVHWSIQILRGSVRPVVTYFLAIAYVCGFMQPGSFDAGAMQGLWQLNMISLSFWFGEKAVSNLIRAKQGKEPDRKA